MTDTKPDTLPPAGDTPPPAGDAPPAELAPGALEQLRAQVAELFDMLKGGSQTAGGGEGSAAGSTPPPATTPPASDAGRSVEQVVRDVLAADDRDYQIAELGRELANLKDGLKPPKRGWGAWLVGDR